MNLNKKSIVILSLITITVVIGTSIFVLLGNDANLDSTDKQNLDITTETQEVFLTEEFGTEEFHTEEIGTEISEDSTQEVVQEDENSQTVDVSKSEEATKESNTSESKENPQKNPTGIPNEGENKQDGSIGNGTNSTPPASESDKPSSPEEPAPSEEEEERYFKCQYWETDFGDFVPYKYGIERSLVRTTEYYEYSDGTSEEISFYEYYEYDCSGYNATDTELKAESESVAANYMDYYNEVLRLTNEVRAENDVAPLTLDTTLCKAASMRALEMDYAQIFSHTRPNGSSCFTTMDFFGCTYTTCGENIAAGYNSPEDVVEGWKNSPGHYANMIDPNFTKLGVGYTPTNVEGEYWYYWTQLFSN